MLARLTTLTLLIVAVISVSGCRAVGLGNHNLSRSAPSPVASEALDASQVISRINRNAEKIESLSARPTVVLRYVDPNTHRPSNAALHGRLALERQRNFRLNLAATSLRHEVADIGSNDELFWFWIKDADGIYVGQYDAMGGTPLSVTMQPDWIVEAMGLRAISEEERDRMTIQRNERAGVLVFTDRRVGPDGETILKQMDVDLLTGRVREHRLLAADGRTLLARAEVDEYRAIPLPSTGGDDAEDRVTLPTEIQLAWPREQVTMKVTMRDARINPQFHDQERAALFSVPNIKGYSQIMLAEPAPSVAGPPSTTLRESRPIPPSGSTVRLGGPEPLRDESTRPTSRDPLPEAASVIPPPEPVITTRIPRPPGQIDVRPQQANADQEPHARRAFFPAFQFQN